MCISIVGILLAIAFPAAQAIRQAARRAHCLSNLKQVMLATLTYESKGVGLPPASDGNGRSFLIALLPYLDEVKLYDRTKSNLSPSESYADRWAEISNTQVVPFMCPAAKSDDMIATVTGQGEYASHYYGVAGPVGQAQNPDSFQTFQYEQLNTSNGPIALQGIFAPKSNGVFASRPLKDVTDGVSSTFGLGEISKFEVVDPNADLPQRSGWGFGAGRDSGNQLISLYSAKSLSRPINSLCKTLNDIPFGSNHPSGTQFALLDGSVHFVDANVSVDILKLYASINEHEKVNNLEAF